MDGVSEVLLGNGPLGAAVLALAVAVWRMWITAYDREDKLRKEQNEIIAAIRTELKDVQQARVSDAQRVIETLMTVQEQSIQSLNSLTSAITQLHGAITRIEERAPVTRGRG
jgi:hypothetical protein